MSTVTEFLPWAAVGFIFGAAAGFQWGKTAKSRIGEAVTTDFENGVVSVEFDTYKAARSGLSDGINQFLDGLN